MKLGAIPNVRAGSDIDRWDRGTARMVVRDIKHICRRIEVSGRPSDPSDLILLNSANHLLPILYLLKTSALQTDVFRILPSLRPAFTFTSNHPP